MNYSFDSSAEMGRSNRENNPRDGIKSESKVTESENEEGPMDLSMPRYPNRTKDTRVGNSYFAAGRKKSAPPTYDVDVNEQPIDYSKKYVESNPLSAAKTNYVPRNSLNKVKPVNREREKVTFSRQTGKADPYGDYAETDLDQPTDYSLRYAEDDTDDEEKQSDSYFTVNEQEDTIKTYCTEGTPYETPFNVSTATSMSDLRLEDGESSRRITRKIIPEKHTTPVYTEEDKEEEENNGETENEILTKESKNMNNELVLNSSNASIEKPMNYYEEGIPGRMARVSSLSSLGCANCPRNEETEENNAETSKDQTTPSLPDSPIASMESNEQTEDRGNPLVPVDSIDDSMNDEETAVSGPEEEKEERVVDKEGKVVTFGGEDHYAEQTPLMFSRSSSLGSLSGFEQQSIHDDRSSIVSDFSRITSGVVSPSELPDSPTQTVPPSPRHNNQKSNTNDLSPRAPMFRNYSYVKSPRAKSSIFEDNVAAFKEESTPLEFSAATSLSSLTIDDEPKIIMDKKEKDYPEKSDTMEASLVDDSANPIDPEINDVNEESSTERVENDGKNREQMSDEDDEAIVMACISMGMRSTMYRQISTPNPDNSQKIVSQIPTIDSATNLVRYQTSSTLDRLVADVSVNSTNSVQPPPTSSSSTEKTENSTEPTTAVVVPVDCVRIYCTEDTPAVSPTGSQSSLSALSMLSISDDIQNYERDQGSGQDEDNSSGEDARLVEECIRAGMKQALGASFSFPSTALSTKFHSPSHVRSTKKFEECLPVEGRQASSTSTPIHASSTKKNECDSLQEQSSMRKTDSCSSSQNSPMKKVDGYFSSRVSPTKTLEDYSQSHVSATKKFDAYESNQASTMKKFEAYESSQASPMKKFEAYESGQTSPTKKFEAYGSSQASPTKKFETYGSSQASPTKKFETYGSSQASPTKKFETYGSSQASPMKKFESYGSSQASPMKKFESYGSNQASPTKKFESYGSSQASPTKKFESYSSSHLSTLKKYDGNLPRSVETRSHVSTTHLPSQGNFTSKIDPCSSRHVTTTKKYEGQHSPRHVSSRKKVEAHSPSHGTKRYDGNLPNHGSSTKRYEGPLPRPIDNRQASLMSSPSHVSSLKKYEGHLPRPVDSRHLSSISLPRSIDNRHVSSISLSSSSSSMRKFEGRLPRPVDPRQAFTVSSRTTIASNDIPAHHTPPPRSHSAGADHDRTPNDDSSSHSDEDAILAQTIQSVMPKGTISTSSFLKVHATRKTPERSPRHAKLGEESLSSSSRSMNTIIRITEAQITITGNDELLESARDNSSLTEEEEALLLAQCIRSGMATALNMPKDSDYQRKQ